MEGSAMTMRLLLPAVSAAALLGATAHADEDLHLTIANHRYQPDRLEVPAGVKFKLVVRNADETAEEFESSDLAREKLVAPGREITVFLGPLKPGEYRFFGDFHQDTAQGVLVAK
jgi:plastocyanin